MQFKYKVFGQDTKIHEGFIDDISKDNVISKLQSEGNIVISVDETQAQIKKEGFFGLFEEKVKVKELVIATKQLATLIGGGVQVLRAFKLLSQESDSKALAQRFKIISDDIQTGFPVYKALARHGDIFDPFFVSMVHSGEESGKLKDVLAYLADYTERNFELVQKTKKALTYPAFVIIAFIGVMLIMTVFVLPKLVNMLVTQGQELPAFTRFIMGISTFILDFWWILIPSLVGGIYYYAQYAKTPHGKAYIDTIKIKLPALGNLYKKLYLSRFADNINTMMSSGVPIVEALQITSDVVDNFVYKKLFERVANKVKDGKLLSMALSDEPMIPNIMVQMTKIGEETGDLGYMLSNVAKYYKKELEQAIDNVISLIEPVMIVALGAGVGLLMASVMMPIYSVATSIQ